MSKTITCFSSVLALLVFAPQVHGQVVMEAGPATYNVDVNSIKSDSGSNSVYEDELVTVNGKITSTKYHLDKAKEITMSRSIEIGYERVVNAGTPAEKTTWVTTRVAQVSGKHRFPKSTPLMPLMPRQVFPFEPLMLTAAPLWRQGTTYYGRERVKDLMGLIMEDWKDQDTRNRGTASFQILIDEE